MLATVLLAIVALGLGVLAGMRLQLARGRVAELRRGLGRLRNEDSLENALAATLQKRKEAEAAGLVHHVRIINVTQFVLTWNWDLSTLLHLLGSTPEEWSLETGWRRKLLARTLALTAYETLTKLSWTFDPKNERKTSLRRALRSLDVEAELAPPLDALHSEIVDTLDKHRELLEGIRNNIIGHRDHDFATQIMWLGRADAAQIEALGFELLRLTNRTLEVLGKVFASVSALPAATNRAPTAA